MENDKKAADGHQILAIGTRHTDFSPRLEDNLYLKQVQQMGKSLITVNTQRTDSGLMAVS